MPGSPEDLITAAKHAQEMAYAPYSNYHVGAALQDENGTIWEGSNVENISYPVGICAERMAIGKMANAGGRRIAAIAVSTKDGGTPCGMCLQALLEFGDLDETAVYTVNDENERKEYKLRDLIPHGFSSKEVGRQNESSR